MTAATTPKSTDSMSDFPMDPFSHISTHSQRRPAKSQTGNATTTLCLGNATVLTKQRTTTS